MKLPYWFRRWRERRRLEAAYRAAKVRITNGTASEHDRALVYLWGTEWTPKERAAINQRIVQGMRAIDAEHASKP